jgi:hypothetical protein
MQSWLNLLLDSRQIFTGIQASKMPTLCAHPETRPHKLVCTRQLAQSAKLA